MRKIILSTSFFLIATALAYPQQVSFKLTGGRAWINGGDYNKGIVGENKYIKDTTLAASGAFKELKSGTNFLAEIINYLNPNIGIGIAGGYFHSSNESKVSGRGLHLDVPFDYESAYKTRLSDISFFLNFHFMCRLVSKVNIDIFAGPAFHIVQFNFENPSKTSLLSMNQTVTFTASAIALGYHAGLGLSFDISPGVALVVDGHYQHAKISNIKGNWALNGSSMSGPINNSSSEYFLWYYEYTLSGIYPRVGFFDKNGPTGDSISGTRKADIKLSGITASAGIKFSF